MTLYTILTQEVIQKILTDFDISGISKVAQLSGGSQNSNYLIHSSSGKYVLTICEQNTEEETINLARLLEHLRSNGFSTSQIVLAIDGDLIKTFNGKPLMVKRFISGKIFDPIPIEIMESIGDQMARLHHIEAPSYIPRQLSYGIQNFSQVADYAPESEFHSWIREKETFIRGYLSDSLPKALIHSDIFNSNVIIDLTKKSSIIMDFEEASYYYRIFDIAMSFVGSCRQDNGIDLNKARAIMKGYSKTIELTKEEVNSLHAFTVYAATAMTFWRHRNFNFVNPTPDLFEHYKELQKVADFVINLDKKVFLEMV